MNKKQKICLWAGLAVLDLFGLIILLDRVVRRKFNYNFDEVRYIKSYHMKWEPADILLATALIIITTAVMFFALKGEKPNGKTDKPEE